MIEKKIVWEGKGERLMMLKIGDGDIILMRTTDYDSGPTRSFVIPAGAVALVAAELNREPPMTKQLEAELERIEKWLDGGCSSWGTPAHDIRAIIAAMRSAIAADEDGRKLVVRLRDVPGSLAASRNLRAEAAAFIERLASKGADEDALRALISPESIEAIAKDIAIACVDCRPEIVEARHRAMVRLGERLRDPLDSDLRRAALPVPQPGDA